MKVLVVIVTFNAMNWIEKCLGSIKKSTIPLSSIVVDNNSTDNTVEFIKKEFPEVKLITEEMKETSIDMSGKVLIADPLDGTTCFTRGNTGKYDGFCVILGFCENAKPIIGVVYDPLNERLYYAEKGNGAFLEEKGTKTKLKVSTQKNLNNLYFVLRS